MDFFKKRKPPRDLSIDELILLRDFRTAESRLERLLAEQNDPKLRVKLGDVLRDMGRGEDALNAYLRASDEFMNKGFTDRAMAAAIKARKLAPAGRPEIEARFQRMDRRKRADQLRGRALAALAEVPEGAEQPAKIDLERAWANVEDSEWVHSNPPQQLLRVLHGMSLERWSEGKRLVAEGSLDPQLVVICSGEVEARRVSPNGVATLRTLETADVVGETTLLDRQPWQVTLVAIVPVTAFVLRREGFEAALRGNPDPRGLIDCIRKQQQDGTLAELISRL